jgi:hypothetical protein
VAIRTIERQGASMNRSCITQRGLVLLLVASISCPALYAGFRPEQHVIVQSETNGPTSVYAADLDGDGDLDVLSASGGDDKIAWYANDGSGHFGPQQVITTAWGRTCAYAADLDGDGDLDVLSASAAYTEGLCYDSEIAWHANDGSGHFALQQVITTAACGVQSVHATDLDGDGDLDALSAFFHVAPGGSLTSTIVWHANDGLGHFGPQQGIAREGRWACCVYGTDLDGDGDVDVLSGGSRIAWYVNDGSGHFGSQQAITTVAFGANCVYAADLDGDGDLDVLSASLDGKIAWYENE